MLAENVSYPTKDAAEAGVMTANSASDTRIAVEKAYLLSIVGIGIGIAVLSSSIFRL